MCRCKVEINRFHLDITICYGRSEKDLRSVPGKSNPGSLARDLLTNEE